MNALTKKTLIAFLRFQVFLALVLFLPAGSFRYWEAWVYLALFLGPGLWMTFYLLKHDPALIERRLEAGPQAEKEPSQKIIMAVAGFLVGAMYAVPGFDHRFHWSSVPLLGVLIADVGVAAGMAIVFLVFRENSFAASTIQVEAGQRVISSGPYGWVRHPMYSGSILGFLAAAPALGSWWALLPAGLLCGAVVVRLIHEERFLAENLAGYGDYCRKVRWRLVPYVW